MKDLHQIRKKFRILKYLFLFAGGLIFLYILLLIYPDNNNAKTVANIEKANNSIKKIQDYSLNINNSIFEGMSADLSIYKIIASKVQKGRDNKYNLNRVNANYSFNQQDLNIKALSGTLDEETHIINLEEQVKIIYNNVLFNAQRLKFNIDTKDASCDCAIEMMYKNSKIRSNSFNTESNGEIINFEGDVISDFNLNDF